MQHIYCSLLRAGWWEWWMMMMDGVENEEKEAGSSFPFSLANPHSLCKMNTSLHCEQHQERLTSFRKQSLQCSLNCRNFLVRGWNQYAKIYHLQRERIHLSSGVIISRLLWRRFGNLLWRCWGFQSTAQWSGSSSCHISNAVQFNSHDFSEGTSFQVEVDEPTAASTFSGIF